MYSTSTSFNNLSSVNQTNTQDKFANLEKEIARLSNDINANHQIVDQNAVAAAAANMHAGMGITSPLLQQNVFSPGMGVIASPDPRSILSPAMPGGPTPAGLMSPAQASIQAQALLSPQPNMAGMGVLSPQMAYPKAAQSVLSPPMMGAQTILTPTPAITYGRPVSVNAGSLLAPSGQAGSIQGSPVGRMMYLESPMDGKSERSKYAAPKTSKWMKTSCSHFWCLGIAIILSTWILSWLFAGMAWSIRPQSVTLAVAVSPQTGDPTMATVNFTFTDPLQSMLGQAVDVEFFYGASRDTIINIVATDQRYMGMYIAPDFTQILNGRSVPAQVEFIHDGGKNYKTDRDLLFSMMLFNEKLRRAVATTLVKNNVTASPGYWLTGPIQITYTDLNPVANEGIHLLAWIAPLLVAMGCILLTNLISWMVHPGMDRKEEGKWRLIAGLVMTCVLSIGISLMPAIGGGVNVNSMAGLSMWAWLWYIGICYMFMWALLYQVTGRELGQAIAVGFVMIQAATNSGYMNNDMSNGFYQIGKIFPAFYATRELKTIMFGSYSSTTATNVCVVLAWLLVTGSVAIAMYLMTWNKIGKSANEVVRQRILVADPTLVQESVTTPLDALDQVESMSPGKESFISAPSIKQTAYY